MSKRSRYQPQLPLDLSTSGSSDDYYRTATAFILWIDILGFKELLRDTVAGFSYAERRLWQLELLVQAVKNHWFPFIRQPYISSFFSDTLVLVFPERRTEEAKDRQLCEIPMHAAQLQNTFLYHGFVVRGALSKGPALIGHDGAMLSSERYAALYEAETGEAIYPRIILSGKDADAGELAKTYEGVVRVFRLLKDRYPTAIATDQDGRPFLNYLLFGTAVEGEFLEHHKELIKGEV